MLLNENEVVLISHRRMFQQDEPRYFLGRVAASEGTLIKVKGYSFVRDFSNGNIIRKDEQRTKVLSLTSPGFLVYQLPQHVDIENSNIKSGDGDAILMDGMNELMNLTERAHSGHF